MHLWFIKSKLGWIVRDYIGKIIAVETMMCNCKAHAIRLNTDWKRISDRSTSEELRTFKQITGIQYHEPEDCNY